MPSDGWWARHNLLKPGSRGPEVEALQRALLNENIPKGLRVTSVVDQQTADSVKAFQRQNFLIDDGTVGPITHSILFTTNYKFAISHPPIVRQPLETCWAAALESVLHSSWARGGRPRLKVAELVQRYRAQLGGMNDISVPGWTQIVAHDLRLRGQQLRAADLRLEQVVWLLRRNQMHLVMVHDMTGSVRHTVVIYGVEIRRGAPRLLVMDPMYGMHSTVEPDNLRQHAHQLFISMPGEVQVLPHR